MEHKINSIGRAKTVLVFGNDKVGLISTITARAFDKASEQPISFTGPVSFSSYTISHIKEIILPILNSILEILDIPEKSYEISVVNLNATSAMDIGIDISGFSADVPVFLALLSSALKMALPDDVVSTGHITSFDGDIRLVKNLPAKIDAAVSDPNISKIIIPDIESDTSSKILSPQQKEHITIAIIEAKSSIRIKPVNNITDLLHKVFTDEAIVWASLKTGFFLEKSLSDKYQDSILEYGRLLTTDNDKRFWSTVENYLFEGEDTLAKEFILCFINFHIEKKIYPKDFGLKLTRLIQSIPTVTRKLKIKFPFIPMENCIKLSQFSTQSDHDDIIRLYNTISGKIEFNKEIATFDDQENNYLSAFDMVLSSINIDALTKKINLPIDTARARFVMESITVESNEEFLNILSSFYIHILRHTGSLSSNIKDAESEAVNLLENAFRYKGGYKAAFYEAQTATQGGLRYILNIMTEEYKRKKQEIYINSVLKRSIESRNGQEKILFIKAFLKRFESYLPDEIKSKDPKTYASHYEEIARAYVQSLDKVNQYLNQL